HAFRRRDRRSSGGHGSQAGREGCVTSGPPSPPARAAPEPTGRGEKDFARSFPDDPELAKLLAAFEAGDYRTVHEGAPKLAERTADAAVRKAALDLKRRIEPDPVQL